MHDDSLLSRYPKARPPLPAEYQKIYEQEYRMNRDGGSLVTRISRTLEEWMHKRVASGELREGAVLEIGAGTLNQFAFETPDGPYDIVEPFEQLYRSKPELAKVRSVFHDIGDVPEGRRYARITSVAVLEHVSDLPNVLARSALLLDSDGIFQAGIPSEGGTLWHLAWRTTTGVAYWLRNRLDYGVLMRHEHLNTAQEIESVVKCFFEQVTVQRFPLPFLHASFYTYLEARGPKIKVAKALLGSVE